MLVDWPLETLRDYRPERHEPADFREFWENTLRTSRKAGFPARFEPYDSGLRLIDAYDVTFAGFDGEPVRGWFLAPRGAGAPLPCVVEYLGYGGTRDLPHERLTWTAAGYAYLVMETRGRGSDGSREGFMTRGITHPDRYHYRRVFTDAVCAVDTVRTHALVDPHRIVVTGGSQGGGIALAVAALAQDLAGAMIDVPFLCHFRRALEITDEPPYAEITKYCATHRDEIDAVHATLRYFDGVNFAAHASVPALFSVALRDAVCPPSTVFAAYNHYAGDKDIRVWPYNGHEGGGGFQAVEQLRYVAKILGRAFDGTTARPS